MSDFIKWYRETQLARDHDVMEAAWILGARMGEPMKDTAKRVRAMKKIKKQKSIRELRKALWRALSKWVRLVRDKNVCYTCGRYGNEAGHYIPRSQRSSLYFDERNVHCQCTSCNSFMSGNLVKYALRLEDQYGMGILQEFALIKEEVWKPTHQELEDRIAEYKRRIEKAGC